MGLIATLLGFATVMTAITWYLLTISVEKVPKSVTAFAAVLIAGIAIAVAGMGLDPGVITVGLAVVTAAMAGLILYLLPLRKLPDGALVARIGQPMPAIVSLDQDGRSFDLADLRGQRVMVKFFRGSW